MAVESLPVISAALSQLFAPEFARQFNRQAVTASILPARAGQGAAKNVAWDAEFSGTSAQSVAEGSDVASGEFLTDVPVPAILNWANYRSSFQITENEIDAAAQSMGSPTAMLDMFAERVYNANTKLISVINSDLFSGNGTDGSGNPNLVGLAGGPLEATGTYAGINRSTYSEWGGNVLANGGVGRPLTFDLLYQLEANIFTAAGEQPDVIVCSPGVFRKYSGLFEALRFIPGQSIQQYGTGVPMNNAVPGGDNLSWRGIPVVRDRNCPAGYLFMLNRNYVELKYLPHINPGDAFGYGMNMLSGNTGGTGFQGGPLTTATSLPARIVLLAKTGDAVKASLKTVIQLAVRRPNSSGYIKDISEV